MAVVTVRRKSIVIITSSPRVVAQSSLTRCPNVLGRTSVALSSLVPELSDLCVEMDENSRKRSRTSRGVAEKVIIGVKKDFKLPVN